MLNCTSSFIVQKTLRHAISENRKSAKLKTEKTPSGVSSMATALGTHLVFQGGPLLLLLRPKTIKETTHILMKSAYWGAIYNVGPKLLHECFPHSKNTKFENVRNEVAMSIISASGFVALNAALGHDKLALLPTVMKTFNVMVDAVSQGLAKYQSSNILKNASRSKKVALSVLLSAPIATLMSNPKNIFNPEAYGKISSTHLAVAVKQSFGKDFANFMDGLVRRIY